MGRPKGHVGHRDSAAVRLKKSMAQLRRREIERAAMTPEQRDARLEAKRRRWRARDRVSRAGLETWRHVVDRAVELEITGHKPAEVVAMLSSEFGRPVAVGRL
jgi:hypothetical protein